MFVRFPKRYLRVVANRPESTIDTEGRESSGISSVSSFSLWSEHSREWWVALVGAGLYFAKTGFPNLPVIDELIH